MEYILDELKQYVIKEVEQFEDSSQFYNYLIVDYDLESENKIDNIYLILDSKNYKVLPGKIIIYKKKIMQKDNVNKIIFKWQKIIPVEGNLIKIYIIDKKLDYNEFVSIKDNIILNIKNIFPAINTKIIIKPYYEDNNYICNSCASFIYC